MALQNEKAVVEAVTCQTNVVQNGVVRSLFLAANQGVTAWGYGGLFNGVITPLLTYNW